MRHTPGRLLFLFSCFLLGYCQEKEVIPVCKKILIDARDAGGVWWYPQLETSVDPEQEHQGATFANALRDAGFYVTVLTPTSTINPGDFSQFGSLFLIGAQVRFDADKFEFYKQALEQGTNLFILSEFQPYLYGDDIDDLLGIQFDGRLSGTLSIQGDHPLTQNMAAQQLTYNTGSFIVPLAGTELEVLATVDDRPVMGMLTYKNSNVFVMGDINTFQFQPQPFTDNLARWMEAHCK